MWPLLTAVLAACVVFHEAQARPDTTILTVPQRDSFRTRSDAASSSVSADGRYVAFVSYARLAAADTNENAGIYVLDRLTGDVTLESLDADGTPLAGAAGHPRLSGDGRFLTFDAAVHAVDGVLYVQIALRDRTARTIRWIGRSAEATATGWSQEPAISADGGLVVFTSAATDLVPGPDANGIGLDVYTYAVATGEIRRVSLDASGRQPTVGHSYAPSVSATGRYIAFVSTAALTGDHARDDRLAGPTRYGHVYVRDLHTGVATRLSESNRGEPADAGSWAPAMSGDGRYVAFASAASNLVRGDRNRAADVFLHAVRTRVTTLVSRTARGRSANGASFGPAISRDGRLVTFQSEASDLACAGRCRGGEDINLVFDVVVLDRTTGHARRLSSEEDGGWMEESGGAAMSSDGRVIVFSSRHPIDASDTANDFDLFVVGEQEIRR